MKPTALRTEYGARPLGIDVKRPRFGWQLKAAEPGAIQVAYELQVSRWRDGFDDAQLVWQSGRVASSSCSWIAYEGSELCAMTRYAWRVRVWGDGAVSPWSEVSWFETGRFDARWEAAWIASIHDSEPASMPLLRRTFRLDAPPVWARLYITALGLYECRINGSPIGDAALRPGWTDYRRRVVYDTYDVTDDLAAGENVFGASLGDGWYSGRIAWFGKGLYGDRPQLLAELRIVLGDGQQLIIGTDDNWMSRGGPVERSDLLDGEHYDATQEPEGWDGPGYQSNGWHRVVMTRVPSSMTVVSPVAPPVRAVARRRGRQLESNDPAVRLYDLGQNIAGRPSIRVRGDRGASIRLRHGEMLNRDGSLYTDNLRSAQATDIYTLHGRGREMYEPRFTFHGFRYVEVEVPKEQHVEVLGVEGVVLHNDMPVTGAFECSNPLLNQLFSNQQWGQRGNYLEVPTDCPQRDERLGWTGDAQVFAPTACYNMDASGFFAKWLQDLRDAQGDDGRYPKFAPDPTGESLDGGPAWAEAGVICAWRAWLHYGDRRLLETHYDSMCRFIGFLDATSEYGVRPVEREGVRMGYGDWLALDRGEGRLGATPLTLVGTAYHVYAVDLMARIARALGRTEDAAGFSDRAQALRRAFVGSFLDEQGCVQGDTQTGYLLALAFDLLPATDRPRALAHLVARIAKDDDHLSTGFVGTPLLCPVLTRFGRADLAYRIVAQRTYPGWLYSVLQGATTMWERWNSYTHEEGFGPADMNSFNHYAYGAIGQWFYETVLGIAPLESRPGFAEFEAKPIPGGGLSDARGHLETMRGRIESAWQFEADTFSYQLTVPPNARAHVTMPFEAPLAQHEHAATPGGRPVLSLAPGRHELSQRVPKTARTSLTP